MAETRNYAFAGSFYPNGKREISAMTGGFLRKAMVNQAEADRFLSYVAPHAGYIYSGSTAGYTYAAIRMRKDLESIDTVILVGPNHTGYGTPISVSMLDWKTPLGDVANDAEFSALMVDRSELAEIDEAAHAYEHSIEVQLPFLQTIAPGKRAVFVCMGDQSLSSSKDLAVAIDEAAKILGRKVIVVASSDFNHYESADIGKNKDMQLIDALETMDYERFNALVGDLNDTACGFGPITVSLLYAKAHGGKKGDLLRYSNSGEATGDLSSVVDYASIGFG
jgi:AmmeMemoRadiSam system protein B